MFNKKEKNKIVQLQSEVQHQREYREYLEKKIDNLLKDDERQMAALMRQSLGIEIAHLACFAGVSARPSQFRNGRLGPSA